jgi:pimeloyl-ACP methyl ester carboxylesterase
MLRRCRIVVAMHERRSKAVWAGVAGLGALAAAGQRRHMRRIGSDPEDAVLHDPPKGRILDVSSADGTILHAEIFGADAGQTLVLVHGWTEMLSYWTYVIRHLSERGFRVVAYDLRGHGHSEPASGGDYAIARFGEDLEAILESCVPEGERAVVVGHSLGAMSIASWAERHDVERRVSGAALLNTGVGDLISESLLIPVPAIAQAVNRTLGPRGTLGVRAPMPRFSTPLSHTMIRYTAFGPAASPAQVAFYERMLVACPPDVRADAGIAISEIDLHNAVPHLTVPTIVIAGELDKLTPPSHARRIADALPQLERLIVLPDTAHMAPLERPREVSEALAELAAVASRSHDAATAGRD